MRLGKYTDNGVAHRSMVIKVLVFLAVPPILYNFVEISAFSGNLFESFGLSKFSETRELEAGHMVVKDSRHAIMLNKLSQQLDDLNLPPEKEQEMVENFIHFMKKQGENITREDIASIQEQQKKQDDKESKKVAEAAPVPAKEATPSPTEAPKTPNPTEAPKTPSPTGAPGVKADIPPKVKYDVPDNSKYPMIPVIDYNYEHDFIQYHDHRTRFKLPEWLDEFLKTQPANNPQAHHEMLTNPDNKFIVATCYMFNNRKLEDCGGFSDRLALMPYMIWLAHKTGRKFLIKYFKPMPLEEFLLPPPDGFDWRLPEGYLMDEWYAYGNRSRQVYQNHRRKAWHNQLLGGDEESINKKVIFMNINLAIPAVRPQQDKLIGSICDDMWPALFRRLFQPSPGLATSMAPIVEANNLEADGYSVAHVRAKWPDPSFGRLKYKDQKWWLADKGGGTLDMDDYNTTRLLSTLGDHAVECAVRIMPETDFVYMASDCHEVVKYLQHKSPYWGNAEEIQNKIPTRSWPGPMPGKENSTNATEHGWGIPAWEIPTKAKILARPNYDKDAPHFDGSKWDKPHYATFEDMWIMSHAKCHTTGVGGFGRLASVLSGNRRKCASRHRDYKQWGWSCPSPTERKAWKATHPLVKRRRGRRRRRNL